MYSLSSLNSIRIIESAHLPAYEGKIKIDPNFKWIDARTRDQVNRWLCDRFGGTPLIIKPPVSGNHPPVLICNPEIAHLIKQKLRDPSWTTLSYS